MKKHVKEIWLKFGSQEEFFSNEERLLALLDTAPGDCTVRVYDASAKSYKILRGHSFDEKQLSLLTDLLGEGNAKYQERDIEIPKKRERKVPNIVQIIPCTHDMYAVFGNEDGEKYKSRVLMFALCDDGIIYPLHFDSWLGICSLFDAVYDAPNYELQDGEIWEGED
ncbi:MAG: hypothetical protein J1E64_04915 [Acetatifactor sp.]|nr:hypothetical protein [Acetatifactor sp.]